MNNETAAATQTLPSGELMLLFNPSQYRLTNYQAAMKELCARLDILNNDFKYCTGRSPIHHVESRMKSPESIINKMKKQNLPQTCDAMFNEIKDIAGVRVVCSYINDVYAVFKIIEQQDDLLIETVKDYIKNPKPNGYRSLHLIVKVPVRLLTATEYVPVEIQIRTIAMDFWASLEHDLRYKPIENSQNMDISSELLECSETIAGVEEKMQSMAKMISKR